MGERRLTQQARDRTSRSSPEESASERRSARGRARDLVGGVVGEGGLVLDGAVWVNAEAPFRLGGEVAFQQRSGADDEPIELEFVAQRRGQRAQLSLSLETDLPSFGQFGESSLADAVEGHVELTFSGDGLGDDLADVDSGEVPGSLKFLEHPGGVGAACFSYLEVCPQLSKTDIGGGTGRQ